jgi:hypothetical protein
MSFRLCAFRLAVLASVTLPAVIATTARAAECQDLTWSKERLSKLDAAIASGQDAVKEQGSASQIRIAEIDAAIASLEQDVATRKGDAAAKGEALLKDIRSARDAYRAESRQQGTRVMSAAAADAGQPSAVSTSALWSKVDAYLDAVNADLPARQAATQARFAGD